MISEKDLLELYVANKYSSAKIAQVFKCSERAVNYWIKKHGIQKRSISEAVYAYHNPDGDPFNLKEPQTIEEAKLYGLGLGLYWGEGNKKNKNSIRLGNTDSRLIGKFIEFMIQSFGIKPEKLRFGLQIFSDLSANSCLKFWLIELKRFGIKKNQFFKVTVTPARSIGTYREKSKFGVLTVHFSNTKLKNILDSKLPM